MTEEMCNQVLLKISDLSLEIVKMSNRMIEDTNEIRKEIDDVRTELAEFKQDYRYTNINDNLRKLELLRELREKLSN